MAENTPATPPGGSLLIYESEDGRIKLDVRLEHETLWLTQADMARLFDCSSDNISLHLKNIYQEGELDSGATTEEFSVVRAEGARQVTRRIAFYNLDAIISVGYRVKRLIATRFRIWATQRLREYIVKGLAMDDERLKQAGGGGYFDELLARIRDIRSSEKDAYLPRKNPGCHPQAFATRVECGETSASGQKRLQKRHALACGCCLNDHENMGSIQSFFSP
jgi:hypothetical protein